MARQAAPARPSAATATFSSLRGNRPFQLLWASNLFFFGGVWTQTLVLGWLAFELTGSELLVAVYTAARLAPLLLGPVAGALADRYDRVRLLLVACTWATGAVAVVAALATADLLPYGAIVLGGFAIGIAQSPSQPARMSLVLDLVGRENLSNANALNSMALNMTQVIGPALGGGMIAAIGAPAALWVSTAWYVASLLLLLPLRRLRTRTGPGGHASASVLAMVAGGFRAVAGNRLAVGVLLVTLAANVFLWPVYQSFMPVFAAESFGLDAAGLGALLTCAGVGGLVGSLVIAALGDFRFKGALFVLGTTVWGLAWAAFSLTAAPAPAFVLMAVIGLAGAAFGVLQTTLLLMVTDPGVHGRALGLQELVIGVMPAATLVIGVVAEHVGVPRTALGASLALVVCLVVLVVAVPALLRIGRADDAGARDTTSGTPSGADVTSTNRDSGTALIPASEHGHVSTVRILPDAGVPVDHVNRLSWTALHEAIVLGDGSADQVEVVRLLLDAGADPTIRDGDGVLLRDLAASRGYDAIVAELDRAR